MSDFFIITADQQAQLMLRWQHLAERLRQGPVSDAETANAFTLLARHYGRRGRHYHNLSHLVALLRWLDEYASHLHDPLLVETALWFHDVIYRSRRKDNEMRSAAYAVQTLTAWQVEPVAIQKTSILIQATAQHWPAWHELGCPPELATQLDADGRWLLDFDLAILGSAPHLYRAYSQAIRHEYTWVPWPLYQRGRRQVLERFAQRETLFFTPTLRARLETQARQNLAAELAEL